ncbi:PREDICTED: myrosinase 1-like [Papilio xuthus]|uniref:Myrosinase 1-like n=1 Tax=Papilio xuthus TaxID=66420 RepID=A0AAJ6Z4V0_PAPXU|nr:PREDICTED: myrosinase 1-like [Papilio xuthus]
MHRLYFMLCLEKEIWSIYIMTPLWQGVFCVLICNVHAIKFPPEFKFGAATSAYQVEGAWNVSDKGLSIWDKHLHSNPDLNVDHSNADIACDSYRYWREDVRIAADLGVHFYRFSISWPRLLPTGTSERISEDGKAYYNNLINGLLEKGIQPVVTLYHWDLPQRLQNLGGWTNPLIADWFMDYAKVAFSLFGDRVKTWVTINEPIIICDVGYNRGAFAPGVKDPDFGNYICHKNILLAHAKAWRLYDDEYRMKYHGKVGITNHLYWFEPASEEHKDITDLVNLYMRMGIHAVFSKEGGWPPKIEKIVAENSKKQGYSRSRLPALSKQETILIKGTYDFFGLNYYTSRRVRKAKPDDKFQDWPLGESCVEIGAILEYDTTWKRAACSWFWIYPEGIRNILKSIKDSYGDIEVLITENGVPTRGSNLNDYERIDYYKKHLEQVWLAINKDGVNVTAYTAWTMIDNFEWLDGYTAQFGLYQVDFSSSNRTRKPRASAKYYADVIRSRSYVTKYTTDELYLLILFYTILPGILVIVMLILLYCPVAAKLLYDERYTLVNVTD